MLTGAVQDFTFAAASKRWASPRLSFFLSAVSYSACLVGKIEEMFLESCLTSRLEGQRRAETPHLAVGAIARPRSRNMRAPDQLARRPVNGLGSK